MYALYCIILHNLCYNIPTSCLFLIFYSKWRYTHATVIRNITLNSNVQTEQIKQSSILLVNAAKKVFIIHYNLIYVKFEEYISCLIIV